MRLLRPRAGDPLHLLRRATYGPTPELLTEVGDRGTDRWLEDQLHPERLDDTACDEALARFPLAHATPPELHERLPYGAWGGMQDLQAMTLSPAVWSRRQLLEVMVELWSDHLNVTCPSSEVWSGRGSYDRDVVRAHALGRFSDLLVASVTSPAMLHYLDNVSSRGSAPNEDYGREVLELHTVGRDAGYGQAGVVDSARAFTGLTTWNPWNGGTATTHGTFRYRSDWRHVGPLRVLDWTHANADRTAGVGRWNLNVALAQGWWTEGLAAPTGSLYARLLPGDRRATRWWPAWAAPGLCGRQT